MFRACIGYFGWPPVWRGWAIPTVLKNQRISLATCKDLGVGGWGLDNPYGGRILNPLEIIG